MNLFVDTSAFYAILDQNDHHHPEAKKIWELVLMADYRLVTSNYVVIESCALIQHRLGLNAARTFLDDMLSLINTEMIDKNLHYRRGCCGGCGCRSELEF